MHRLLTTPVIALALMVAGCATDDAQRAGAGGDDALIGATAALHNVQGVENAIIRQRTIYPHHFVTDTAALNELGRRDLDVLAYYLAAHGGELNVRRAGASDQLYNARIEATLRVLYHAGVNPQRIRIIDRLPGGDGLPSQTVFQILNPTATAAVEHLPAGSIE